MNGMPVYEDGMHRICSRQVYCRATAAFLKQTCYEAFQCTGNEFYVTTLGVYLLQADRGVRPASPSYSLARCNVNIRSGERNLIFQPRENLSTVYSTVRAHEVDAFISWN